ncbi:MAG: selenide, water dikinase SelD [Acidobacteriota bacterium]
MGPADLSEMVASLARLAGGRGQVLVGPETGDDGGVYLLEQHGLIATADFITPVCDDPGRFGRVAAANALSDVYAMGGRPLFALNLCCFPEDLLPRGAAVAILEGAAATLGRAQAALLGGHTVRDRELKYGLAVVGVVPPGQVLTRGGAQVGDRLLLTKPLGTGVLINAFKFDRLDAAGLEPALVEMERLNEAAAAAALRHGAHAGTDITGFGLAGHALGMAQASGVGLRIAHRQLPIHARFFDLVEDGVSTGCTRANQEHVAPHLADRAGLDPVRLEILFDPQTSGGLFLAVPAANADALLEELSGSGHLAAEVGEAIGEPGRLEIV